MSEIQKYEGDPMQQFQQKVIEKIRTDIAQMLPEEVVKGLFEKAMDDEFFKPRIEWSGYNGTTKTEKPSWFVEVLSKEAKPMLEKSIKAFVESKKEKIQEEINKFLEEQNLMLIILASMGGQMQELKQQLYNIANNIRSY